MMTREDIEAYYSWTARKCLESESPYAYITGVCKSIATDETATTVQKGRYLMLFFEELAKAEQEAEK